MGNFKGFDENRFKRYSVKEHQSKFEDEFENEFRQIIRNHKKGEKKLAPLMFPVMEMEKRKRNGMAFSEVSTPQSSMVLSANEQFISR